MRAVAVAAAVWGLALIVVTGQSPSAYPGMLDTHPAIDYRGAHVSDAVTVLQGELARSKTSLPFDPPQGYLRAILDKLDISVDSQLLLFSKTGIQNAHTTPENPRAFYFNDHVIIGYIPGAPLIEMASHDPRQGVIFQTLSQSATSLQFARPSLCLSCHVSANSLEVPGILVRSNFTGIDGRSMPQLGSFLIDDRSPLEQRWGGWYVTGTHGNARHMGNAFVTDPARPEAAVGESTLNRLTIDARVDLTAYPAKTSDIVALMVFDHQGRAMNLLTRLGWETRIAAAHGPPDFSRGELRDVLDETADYLVLKSEARLSSPIRGVSAFASTFAKQGPRDHHGRSLRDLDLQSRLFTYGCSYMIYSKAFDALPVEAKRAVFARMRSSIADEATKSILDQTKPEWRQ